MGTTKRMWTQASRSRAARVKLAAGYQAALADHCSGACPHCEMGPTCSVGLELRARFTRAQEKLYASR